MKQVINMLVTLLKEPRQSAAPPPPSQSGVSHTKFNTYVAKAAFEQEILLQTINDGGYTIGLTTFTLERESLL